MTERIRHVLALAAAVGLLCSVGSSPATGAQADVWTDVARVVAVGDLHGDHAQFVAVLRDAGVIDEDGRWSGGETHLVQVGDVLDRGADSRQIMDLLMRLEQEAERAGGRVHALIGNHETMNIYGDLHDTSAGEFAAFRDEDSVRTRDAFYERYVDRVMQGPEPLPEIDEAFRQRFDEQFPLGYVEHRRAFAESGTYGSWIRDHNAIVQINDSLFLHGGISPKYASFSVRDINEAIRDDLGDSSTLADFEVLQASFTGDPEGPLWYRGLVNAPDVGSIGTHVDATLEHHGARRIVVGHTPNLGTVFPRLGGKVLSIDVGLSSIYGGPPACLVIEDGVPYSLHRGVKLALPEPGGLVDYLRRAAALEPDGSAFKERVDALGRPAEPAVP